MWSFSGEQSISQKARGTFHKSHHPKMLRIVHLHSRSSLPVVCRNRICLENSPSQPCIEVCASKRQSTPCVSYRTSKLRTGPTALVSQRRSNIVTVHCEQCVLATARCKLNVDEKMIQAEMFSHKSTVSRKLFLRPH